MRRWFALTLLLLAAALTAWACTEAQAAGRPPLNPALAVFQAGDSLGYTLRWSHSPGASERPVQGYDTRVVGVAFGDTVASGWQATSPDTLYGPMIAFDDSLYVRGCVRSVDDRGRVSAWRCSPDMLVYFPSTVPSPPDSVVIDTIPPLRVSAVEVIPQAWAMLVGETKQFCATYTLEDGSTGLGQPVGGWSSFEQQAYCETEYQQWLGRRSG